MSEATREEHWDQSYLRKENHYFYPHEEIVRLFSHRVARRVGPNETTYLDGFTAGMRAFDLGCGMGRYVKMFHEFGFEGYGIDHSSEAIEAGRKWLGSAGISDVEKKLKQADGRKLPFDDNFFDLAFSTGVLDSMKFEIAQECMPEIHRVVKSGAMVFLDLISNEDSELDPGFCGEVTVSKKTEFGTIQNYYDRKKIEKLLEGRVKILEIVHVRRDIILTKTYASRYYLVGVFN